MKKSFKEILGEVRTRTPNFDEPERRQFKVKHLDATQKFLDALDVRFKIHFNKVVDEAAERRDPKKLKKLTKDIWEFRIRYEGLQYRLLAFWERDDDRRLMVTTHAFVKKTDKVPLKELGRANKIRLQYIASNANRL